LTPSPAPPVRGVWSLHPLEEVAVNLRVATEGVRDMVVEAQPCEVGVAGVVGETDRRHLASFAEDDVVRIAGGGTSRVGGTVLGEARGDGGGGGSVHHAISMVDLF